MGDTVRDRRYDHHANNDDYAQAGDLFRLMSEEQKQILATNIAGGLGQTPERIQKAAIEMFARADKDYAARVQKALSKPRVEEPQMEHEPVGATSAPSERRPEKEALQSCHHNRGCRKVALFSGDRRRLFCNRLRLEQAHCQSEVSSR